ncbi:helix-turn-helix domain-containing protein [Blautia producta]|uniref:HTH cro/C1-type domain-containing protein n=1 Tax=Blautia producta TaxID=33035 RepID=A0A4P6LUC3_9FIRM|nr:helix-turn-helix transcriptional regulator [Blautia producta]QBE95954.1 hypothetical protein PMF13cell1_01480 [Blautia producta]
MFKQIGIRIKTARINAGLTQEQLSERLECSSSFISRLETGRISTSLEKLYEISQILNVGLETLLYDFLSDTSPYLDPITIEVLSKLEHLPSAYKQAALEMIQSLTKLYK